MFPVDSSELSALMDVVNQELKIAQIQPILDDGQLDVGLLLIIKATVKD